MKKLNRQTVPVTKRPVKIIQFGAGNFLRGFCDWMVDVLNEKADFNGSIQVVQPIRKGKGIPLDTQDGLYHVVVNGLHNGERVNEVRLITSIDSVIDPYVDYNKFLSLAENTDLEIVFSNTTEAGIVFNENDNQTFAGNVTAFLHHRYKSNKKPLTFLPSELIEKNGETLKAVVYRYIELWKLPNDFKDWVHSEVIFCNTLVDRIVPGFQDVSDRTAFEDQFTVAAEPFHLWVIEAPKSVQDKLPFRKAGLQVKFVDDLTPYRTRKVRILNGAHTILVPVAYLNGFRTVRESIEDPGILHWLYRAIYKEIIPTLDLPQDELEKFAAETIERFKNPFIKHELASIALNSTSKYKVRVLPSLLEYISRKKELPERLVYSLACLIKFYKSDDTPVNDSLEVVEFMKKSDIPIILGNQKIWGQDLNAIEGLADFINVLLQK